jgi:hypothetical protein
LAKRVKLVAIITVAAAALLTGWHLFGRSSAPALATNDAPAASERTLPLPPVRSVAVEPALHVPPVPSGSARPDAIASLLARGAGAPSNSAPAQLAPRDPTLDAWFVKAYLRCWSPPTNLPQGEKYAAQATKAMRRPPATVPDFALLLDCSRIDKTFCLVFSRTPGRPLRTRSTVAVPTPDRRAI